MANDWTASIAAERMELDTEFNERVVASSFSSQQWNLVMTALELEIEGADDPGSARIVPDTSNLSAIMPELERVEQQGPMGGGSDSSGGLLGDIKDTLGLTGSNESEQIQEAERLAEQYCELLQEKLETNGRWESVCRQARD